VFTQGATVFNLSSTSGLTVGDELACWQTDDPDGSVPASTLFVSEKNSTGTNDTSWVGENADKPGAGGGGLAHRSLVTNISGSGVTVADPLVMPTGVFQTARTAQCGWLTAAKLIKNVGLENMTIQTTSLSGSYDSVVSTLGGYNVWMTGVVLTPLYSASFGCTCATDFGFDFKDSIHSTVLGNWINQMHGGGTYTTTSYGVATEGSQWMRVENNIFNGVESPIEIIFASVGNAYLFNFTNTVAANGDTGVQEHSVAVEYNLVEGNSVPQFFAEDLHGNGHFTTLHRNYFRTDGIDIWSYHRWYNIISNVIVAGSRYETKSTDVTTYARGAGSAYRLGFPEQYGSAEHWTSGGTSCTFSPSGSSGSEPSCVPSDSGVWTSSFRWKNYDSFTGTTKYDSSEVPTAGTQFTNAVPASHTDPASYVYSVSPSWWPNKAWPIIGADDVSGGAYEGGRVYKTPAQDCFEAAGGVLGSYSGTTSASFAYSTCYNGSGAGQGGGTTGTPGYGTGVLRRMRPLLN
jgi:hypothetical protein